MTADLAEEHSTATLAAERLEAEQADRLKLEKDKAELVVRCDAMLHAVAVCNKSAIARWEKTPGSLVSRREKRCTF